MTPLRPISLVVWTLAAVHSAVSIPRIGLGSDHARALSPRQSSLPIVPSQCATTCDPVSSILEAPSCNPTLCCTPLFQSGYFNCLKCLEPSTNVTKQTFAKDQALLDALTITCSELGFSLPELTFPDQNASRILSTVSATQTSKASSISQITISSLPSSLSSSDSAPAISQKTVTSVPPQSSTPTTGGQTTASPSPTQNAAMHHDDGFGMMGLLGVLISAWTMF
ncbi:hypothetical protein B0H19DRAFT_1076105 [Mycena capillaripes]|nr:hypothetical protein B0H19DRAFT_1076105 [Mycena capillaripes]